MRIESFLQHSPLFQTSRIARKAEAAVNTILTNEDLTFFESLVLAAIFFEKGEARPSDLAEAFQTTRGNVSHCISSLEAKGLVRRKIDTEDARAVQLILSPSGRRRAARTVGILDRMQSRFEQEIGATTLERMLREMAAVEKLCCQLAESAESSV
jgi:DNA-binding MarR family transcriptional regulator